MMPSTSSASRMPETVIDAGDPTDANEAAGIFDRVRTRAAVIAALERVAAVVERATAERRVAPALGQRAAQQLAKAATVARAQATPTDVLALLVHLTAARTFLTDGRAPAPLIAELNAAIARVHHLARVVPAVFRPTEDARTVPTPPTPRLLP